MSAVEVEARQLLRWFPSRWRQAHGDALVGTLLDAAEAGDRDELTVVERRDLIASGIRERGVALVPDEVRRQAAPIALGVGASLAALQLLVVEWSPWSSRAWEDLSPIPYGFGPFTSAGVVIDALWLAALVFGLLHLRRAVVATLGASVVASIVLYFAPLTPWSIGRPASTAMAVMALLAVVSSSAPITARLFRPITLATAALAAAVLVICTWGSLPRSGWFASSLLFGHNLNAAPVGAVILVAVALFSLVGLHRSAQATLLALGPAWSGLLIRSHTGDAGWLVVIAVAIVTVLLVALSNRIGWRLRIERTNLPAE